MTNGYRRAVVNYPMTSGKHVWKIRIDNFVIADDFYLGVAGSKDIVRNYIHSTEKIYWSY